MTNILVGVDDTTLARILERADNENTSPEHVIQNALKQLFDIDADVAFEDAMEYVLKKNSELYKRLA